MKLSDVTVTNASPMVGPEQITKVAQFAEQGWVARKGTAAQRAALPTAEKFDGLIWSETDSGRGIYQWNGTTWLAFTRAVATRKWQFKRGSDGSLAMTSFTGLVSATITAAPAGQYNIQAIASLSGTVATDGNVRVLANGTNISDDLRADVPAANSAFSSSPPYPFTWAGGDLTLAVQYRASAGTITVFGPTQISAIWVGP